MMNAAAPDGTPPRRIGDKNSKNSLPAVPRRGLEAEIHHRDDNLPGSDENWIDSWLFFDSADLLLSGLNPGFVLIFFDIDLLEGIMRCKQIFYLTTEIFCLAHDIKPS